MPGRVTGTLEGLAAFELGDVLGQPTLAARGAQGFIWKVQTTTGAYAVRQPQPLVRWLVSAMSSSQWQA